MAFRIEPRAPIEAEMRRVLVEQIERAETRLRSGEDRAVAVHEARKHFKRMRATLRLLRPAIGQQAFKRENAAIRDTARLLAGARDAHVLMQTLTKLEADDGADLAALWQALEAKAAAVGSDADADAVKDALKRLKVARSRLARLAVDGGPGALAKGLRRCMREARAAMAQALEADTDEAWHEWRKRVQQHWRQMGLIGKAWPDYFAARAKLAKRLSGTLGDDHDLAMLVAFIAAQPDEVRESEACRALVRRARDRQRELRRSAAIDGGRLFADRAGDLARRLEAYWSAASASRSGDETDAAGTAAQDDGAARPRPSKPNSARRGKGAAA